MLVLSSVFAHVDYQANFYPSSEDTTYVYVDAVSAAAEIILGVNQKLDEATAFQIASTIYTESNRNQLDMIFVMSVMMTESRFRVNAKSHCGAVGLMQIMPSTFRSVARRIEMTPKERSNMFDISSNIKVGCAYLKYLQDRYGDNYNHISAGYNGGPGVADRYIKRGFNSMPKETRNYVMKVNKYHGEFSTAINN